MRKNVALVLAGLVLGSGLGALATGRVRAQALPPPPAALRWEQDCEQTRGLEETRAVARTRGEAGWELVAVDAGVLCFKRPIPAARPAEPWPGY